MALTTKENVRKALQERYPDCMICNLGDTPPSKFWEQKIEVDKVTVKYRHFSPLSKGDKSSYGFYLDPEDDLDNYLFLSDEDNCGQVQDRRAEQMLDRLNAMNTSGHAGNWITSHKKFLVESSPEGYNTIHLSEGHCWIIRN